MRVRATRQHTERCFVLFCCVLHSCAKISSKESEKTQKLINDKRKLALEVYTYTLACMHACIHS